MFPRITIAEIGAVQLKAKRIRFIFDLSASMYRNQYDGRLTRSLEAAVMVLEAFARLSRKEKYRIDLVGQSGEEAVIPLVALDNLPTHGGDRYKVVQKMAVIPQYTWVRSFSSLMKLNSNHQLTRPFLPVLIVSFAK